jgi:hypothetical protein
MYRSEASCEGRIVHELIPESNREGSMFQTLQILARSNRPNVTTNPVLEQEVSDLPPPKLTIEPVLTADL